MGFEVMTLVYGILPLAAGEPGSRPLLIPPPFLLRRRSRQLPSICFLSLCS